MSKIQFAITLTFAVALLSGCAAPYHVPKGAATAQIRLLGESTSTASLGKHFFLHIYKNEDCEVPDNGSAVFNFSASDKNSAMSESATIQAGKPATITASYKDARFAQNRTCESTGTFTPQENENYTVVLNVNTEVTECYLGVFRGEPSTATRVNSLHIPTAVCTVDGKREGRNGKPLWMNWVFTM